LSSRLFDIDPPTLLSYSAGEIIHTQAASDPKLTPSRFIPSGQSVEFVVRLSQRQSGVGQVYLQIKDPNSKYQDAAGLSIRYSRATQIPSLR